ncbi:FliH/SctL family protein [Candidatus Rhodobacter oscarellae]|uniref:FliH/SctL family protein n=1 Tax=Candidatus Rhodobacter oscarellae TaxID=1675527 RepID=UPI00067171B6|nr:hypothetical protein [Candidatus Rhodobacter lobularis]
MQPGALIPSDIVESYLSLDAQWRDLHQDRARLMSRAEEITQEAESKGFEEGLSRVVAKAVDYTAELNTLLNARTDALEQDLTELVAGALEEILGTQEQTALARQVVQSKLEQLRRFDTLIFSVAPGLGPAIKAALSDMDMPLNLSVIEDETLKNGRILVETPEGYFDLGVAEQGVIARRLMAKRITALLRSKL